MRITKKTKLFRGYTRDFAISNVIDEMTYKLGQLEDILEKYGIDDVKELDKILEIHMFLLNHDYQTLPRQEFDKLFEKLKQYKDIEDELGIDLITLFKALKNGIYGKVGNEVEHILAPHLSWHSSEIYIFKIKDYGKTWALTKEELL